MNIWKIIYLGMKTWLMIAVQLKQSKKKNIQSRNVMLPACLSLDCLFLEPITRKIRRKVKWQSLNKLKSPRLNPGRRAAAKAGVVLKVTAVTVKVAATTVAARRSLDPTAVAQVTTSQGDSELIQCLNYSLEQTAGYRQFSSNVRCLYFRRENYLLPSDLSLRFWTEMLPSNMTYAVRDELASRFQ